MTFIYFKMNKFQKYFITYTFKNHFEIILKFQIWSNDATHQIVNHDNNDIIYRYDNPSNIKISEIK